MDLYIKMTFGGMKKARVFILNVVLPFADWLRGNFTFADW